MYQLQYFNEAAAEWRGAGFTSTSLECARSRMRGAAEECGHCVSFRIHEVDVLASLSDAEYESATTPI